MIHLKKILLSVLLTAAVSINARAQEYFIHTVTQGQGLYSISRTYGVSEEDIIKLNPGSEKVIREGQKLRIPNRELISSGKFHTIQKGETLFRLSVENRISVKELCDANPGLSAQNFKVGQVITIPAPSDEEPLASTPQDSDNKTHNELIKEVQTVMTDTARFKATHVVRKRETIFRICRNYDISQADFLKANPQYRYTKLRQGAIVNIPFTQEELEQRRRNLSNVMSKVESLPDSTLFNMHNPKGEKIEGAITAALLLPFSLNDSSTVEQQRMVEFYQGMLLALDKLKDERVSVYLKVFDTQGADQSIEPLLNSGQLNDVDIVFGPKCDTHTEAATRWSTKNKIPLVLLSLTNNVDDVFNNPYVFQLKTPQSYYHQEIYDHFMETFPNANVIILDAQEYKKNEFMDGLKTVMKDHMIPYTTIDVDTAYQEMMDALVPDRKNIFIINSSNSEPLNTMLPVLQLITRTKAPEIETCLFGYPDYQKYALEHLDEMYEVDTWFFSWFYTNNMLQQAVDFNSAYRRAYSRQMKLSFPSYASFGYDTGYYFLKGLSLYGEDMDSHLDDIETDPVQMGFKFERVNNWGGFINRKAFFVHFSKDYKVEKIDFDR